MLLEATILFIIHDGTTEQKVFKIGKIIFHKQQHNKILLN